MTGERDRWHRWLLEVRQTERVQLYPNLPPLAEMIDRALSAAEGAEFTAHLRPLVEQGPGEHRMAVAYLTAS